MFILLILAIWGCEPIWLEFVCWWLCWLFLRILLSFYFYLYFYLYLYLYLYFYLYFYLLCSYTILDGESNFFNELLLLLLVWLLWLRWLGNAEKQCYDDTILLLRVGLIIFDIFPLSLFEFEYVGLFKCSMYCYCLIYSLIFIFFYLLLISIYIYIYVIYMIIKYKYNMGIYWIII